MYVANATKQKEDKSYLELNLKRKEHLVKEFKSMRIIEKKSY